MSDNALSVKFAESKLGAAADLLGDDTAQLITQLGIIIDGRADELIKLFDYLWHLFFVETPARFRGEGFQWRSQCYRVLCREFDILVKRRDIFGQLSRRRDIFEA